MVQIFSRAQVPGAEHGHLNAPLIRKHGTAFETMLRDRYPAHLPPLYYVVGPEAMTLATAGLLEEQGVSRDRIFVEAFFGY